MSNKSHIVLSEDVLRLAVEAGISAYKEEKRKADKKREQAENPIEITKRILKSYRTVKGSLGEEVFTEEELNDFRLDFFRDLMESHGTREELTEMRIRARQRRKAMDNLQVLEIDEAYEKYRSAASKKDEEDIRRCRVLFSMYLSDDELSIADIADAEGIAERTVYKDLREAVEIYSVYLLGSLVLPTILRR